MIEDKSFGHTLKKIRAERGLTQAAFAEMIGTSKQVVSRYENNQRCPKITIAAEFAEKLEIPLERLVYGDVLPGYPISETQNTYAETVDSRLQLLEETDDLSKEEIIRTIDFIRGIKNK